MRRTFIVFALLAFGAIVAAFTGNCAAQSARPSPTPIPTTKNDFESVKEYLLTSAATDFHEHQPPFPAKFRKVRIGHVGDTTKSGSYRMCGEFLPATEGVKAKWNSFVTIKTSKYEQFLGSNTTYCADPKITWTKTGDLSSNLQSRLDELKAKKQQ